MSKPVAYSKRDVADLSCGEVSTMPLDQDWSEGFGETWDYHAASRCEKCGKVVLGRGGERHNRADEDEVDCDGHVPEADGPMMNYFYPCQIDDVSEAAKALVDTCLVVVEFTDGDRQGQTGLALSGGGMDLTWEICEAYMLLGHLPPVHFAGRLPKMATRWNARRKWIGRGCVRSAEVALGWAARAVEDIKSTLSWCRTFDRKSKAERKASKPAHASA